MRVAACLVTRGDVPMDEIIESLPEHWEVVVWDNSKRTDLAVYGRYAAIELTDADVIYVQDDDCVLTPDAFDTLTTAYQPDAITANMPSRFRHDFYTDHCLVGFGAMFHRSLPAKAFDTFMRANDNGDEFAGGGPSRDLFLHTCDIVFTVLTPYHLVDLGYTDLPWASAPNRMWKQPNHVRDRAHMLDLAMRTR